MDALENSFLKTTQKLNEKRREQLKKRLAKTLPEVEKLFDEGKTEEVERILETFKMPSSKEWQKAVYNLVDSSARSGVLRAHFELIRLKELYEFADIRVTEGNTSFKVVFPPEADKWIRDYGYEIGVITEDTTREKIREAVQSNLRDGLRGRDLTSAINGVTDTWVSQQHAETIARTETAKMYNAGRVARWSDPAEGGFVEAMQYDSIVDTRTTDLCRSLDGKIVAMTNSKAVTELTPPNHFKCRATWIAVTRYEEWEDDFPEDAEAEKGFVFETPLPKLLKGKAKKVPLVQTVVKPDPKTVTDPLIIRTLDDDDFRTAIANVTDLDMKYFLVKERAQQMVVAKGLFRETLPDIDFDSVVTERGFYGKILGKNFKTNIDPAVFKEVQELSRELNRNSMNLKELHRIMDDFTDNHIGLNYLEINMTLREMRAMKAQTQAFNGFQEVSRSAEARKLLTITRPPRRGRYKDLAQLHDATDEGEDFMMRYVHDKLAPASGIKMRFDVNNYRAYAQGGIGEMFFGPSERNAGVIVHESAHIMHWNNREVSDLINTFFMRRTKNLTIPASKRHGEKVLEDDFFNSYIGRIYGWEEGYSAQQRTSGGKFYGQEVFSMGLQRMQEDPADFLTKDPEHFYFTYALMEGLF